MKQRTIYIGWDPREPMAFGVTLYSLLANLDHHISVRALVMQDLVEKGLYTRPTLVPFEGPLKELGSKGLIDQLSIRGDYDGRISTHHAIARFWVPMLAKEGWALFMDGDMLVRQNVSEVFNNLDESKALYCVKHNYDPLNKVKKGGDVQSRYQRKNWSSFMIFNCDHPSNKALTLDVLNSHPGRDLHAFFWLNDNEIGELDPKWNWLVGHEPYKDIEPAICHFTEGCPNIPGFEFVPYAEEWRQMASARDGGKL